MASLFLQPRAMYFYLCGTINFIFGTKKNAIANYNKAINIKPDFAKAYVNRGNAKCILEDYEGAVSDYNKALDIKPDYDPSYIHFRIGIAKLGFRDFEGAIFTFSRAIKVMLDDSFGYGWRGTAKNELGDFEGAIADFTKAMVLIKSIELESLQSYFSDLQELEASTRSRFGAYHVSEGRWYEGLAQLQSSLDYYRQTDSLERRADVLAQIARVQLLLGDWDKARMLYRDVLRL